MLSKKFLVAVASLLLVVAAASAQTPAGVITGRIADATGLPLPGVDVTLQGTDINRTFTTGIDGRYRFLDLAPGDYKLTSALTGFATSVRDRVVVGVGQTVELPVTLAVGTLTETVKVTAPSPMVDARQTGTATNVTIDELTNIPTSRDPFSLLRSVNGVLVDRVNIGGNETGQQSNFVSKGTRPQDAVWTMDGVAITDMTLTGSSPTYFNWDNFEAVHVATAGQAITQQTGGPGLDFIVKRGTNAFHGGAHSYLRQRRDGSVQRAGRARGERRHARHRGPQQTDWRLRLRDRRTARAGQRLVLWFVFRSGRAARAPHGHPGRPHPAEESEREGELAGDAEGHVQRPVLRRLQDQRQPQPGHLGHHVRRAHRDVPPGQRVHEQPAARALQTRGRPRRPPQHVSDGQVCLLQHRFPPHTRRRYGALVRS